MPPPETASMPDDAVLWLRTGYDGYGAYTVGDPQDTKVRWMFGTHESIDPMGGPLAISATAVVGVDIPIGSQLWKGTIAEWDAGDAETRKGVYLVSNFINVPDIKGRIAYRYVELSRFRDVQ